MRRLLFLAGLAAGAYFLWRTLSRRRLRTAPEPPSMDFDPAAELRRKLAETRETPVPQQPDSASASPEPEPDDRRRQVHEDAREAVEQMRATDPAE
jgi:hypothetical protein